MTGSPPADGKQHYFLRILLYDGEPLLVAGYTIDHEAYRQDLLFRDELSAETLEAEMTQLRENLEQGRVMTRSFSSLIPDGELGPAPLWELLEITSSRFELYRMLNFNLEVITSLGGTEAQIVYDWITHLICVEVAQLENEDRS